MYKIPLNNSPNQKFNTTVYVNGENIDLEIELNYNSVAGYWCMTVTKVVTGEILFTQLPLLFSYDDYANIATQMQYKLFGSVYCVAIQPTKASRPYDNDLGSNYILVWSDNDI